MEKRIQQGNFIRISWQDAINKKWLLLEKIVIIPALLLVAAAFSAAVDIISAQAGYDRGYSEAWDEGFSSGYKEAKQETEMFSQ